MLCEQTITWCIGLVWTGPHSLANLDRGGYGRRLLRLTIRRSSTRRRTKSCRFWITFYLCLVQIYRSHSFRFLYACQSPKTELFIHGRSCKPVSPFLRGFVVSGGDLVPRTGETRGFKVLRVRAASGAYYVACLCLGSCPLAESMRKQSIRKTYSHLQPEASSSPNRPP